MTNDEWPDKIPNPEFSFIMKTSQKTHKKTNYAAALVAAAFTLGAATAYGITIETVPVGYAGNAADVRTGYGAVSYEYQIGKYEVTNAQYAAFLNAVDSTGANTYSLYDSNMSSSPYGGITWNGSSGRYEVKADYDLKPVNYISFYDAARFVNWLTNGQGSGGTENGLYVFSSDGATLVSTPDHATSTGWVIPNEAEWYKAAYYDPTLTLNEDARGYWRYPTQHNGVSRGETGAVDGANYYVEGEPYDVMNVGSYASASSYFGTYDQGGNLWEWNDTLYSADIGSRVLRGGAFSSNAGDLSVYTRIQALLEEGYNSMGFRVAYLTSVPEPSVWGSATGLTMLVIGVWVRRGRRTVRG
jgi:formylglycine-generating enzyme required for sulfatase activity